MIEAYPLQWPVGWRRTPPHMRKQSRYQMSFARARDDLVREIHLMGGRDVVVSSNIPLRRDGLPYASMREPEDAGIAVYWTQNRKPRVIPCDCWKTTRENLRALARAIACLRELERTGAGEIQERAFQGFAALPESTGLAARRHWREVLQLVDHCDERDIVKQYRQLARELHPDRGGSDEAMAELNRAKVEALAEIEGTGHG